MQERSRYYVLACAGLRRSGLRAAGRGVTRRGGKRKRESLVLRVPQGAQVRFLATFAVFRLRERQRPACLITVIIPFFLAVALHVWCVWCVVGPVGGRGWGRAVCAVCTLLTALSTEADPDVSCMVCVASPAVNVGRSDHGVGRLRAPAKQSIEL